MQFISMAAVVFLCLLTFEAHADEPELGDAEQRAVQYLLKEIPRWRPEHRCSSCHHQGDGVRSLFRAIESGAKIEVASLQDTINFLAQPESWDRNGPEGPFSDRKLARIQFSHALVGAISAGVSSDKGALREAAEQLVRDQIGNGSWDFTGADEIGSPINLGRPLSTAVALKVLRETGDPGFEKSIAQGERWLEEFEPKSVLNAAAILVGLGQSQFEESNRLFARCLKIIEEGQSSDGGWGPYINAPPEPFDTAVVLCAISGLRSNEWTERISKGRRYLVESQLSDGSWPETTRPGLRESYAHRISTTGWALIGLLDTRHAAAPSSSVESIRRYPSRND